jgi:hypothetical protein
MADESPHLRVVDPRERRNSRRPGPAVAWILVYAAIFGAALIYLRAKSPLLRKSEPHVSPISSRDAKTRPERIAGDPHEPPRSVTSSLDRDSLLSGGGLPEKSRGRYFQRIATERCDCGCERSIADCLVHEPTCTRSPSIATHWIQDSQFKTRD